MTAAPAGSTGGAMSIGRRESGAQGIVKRGACGEWRNDKVDHYRELHLVGLCHGFSIGRDDEER